MSSTSPPRSHHQLPAVHRRIPGNVARLDPTSSTPSAIIRLFVFGDPCGAHEIARTPNVVACRLGYNRYNTADCSNIIQCLSAVQTAVHHSSMYSSSVAVEKILAKCRLTTIPPVTRSWTFGLRHKVGSGK